MQHSNLLISGGGSYDKEMDQSFYSTKLDSRRFTIRDGFMNNSRKDNNSRVKKKKVEETPKSA